MPDHASSPTIPRVTIIVAAYNRGAVLARSLRTAIAQTEQDWQALIIGDCCTDDTAAQIAALGDPRLRFINLPDRFGEQAGPNSVGMAMAQSPYIAFLNQDDYWLPNHLSLALAALERSGADLLWTRAAFFTNRGAWNDRILFTELSLPDRSLADAYDHHVAYAEPLSSWVGRTDALHRLGPMTLASQSVLVPILNYAQRAYRKGLSLHSLPDITVLKDRVWHPPPSYASPAPYGADLVHQIETGQIEDLLHQIAEDIWLASALGLSRSFGAPEAPMGRAHPAVVDSRADLNLSELQQAARSQTSALLTTTQQQRTGTSQTHQPDLAAMIAYAKALS